MDDDFRTDSIQTPCISDTVEDFTQIRSVVSASSADYDLTVFTPSFDTADGGYIVNNPNDMKTASTASGQDTVKSFLEDGSMMDIQLYEGLQNHHNYSLKPAQTKMGEALKEKENASHSVMNDGLSFNMPGNSIGQTGDTEDESLDISDPLKEICRSSSPLYVHTQEKEGITCENLPDCNQTNNQFASKDDISNIDTDLESNDFETQETLSYTQGKEKVMLSFDTHSKHCQLNNVASSNNLEPLTGQCNISGLSSTSLSGKTDIDNADILDEIGQDKTVFSENLGLMPKDSELKIITEKLPERKGVQTRRSLALSAQSPGTSLWSATGPPLAKGGPVAGHKHMSGLYKCGSCSKTFVNICKLHQHLEEHSNGGSYYYNHILKTAFPKFDTVCGYTQTEESKIISQLKPFGKGIRLKIKKSKEVNKHMELKEKPEALKLAVEKRHKRGRPPKTQKEKNIKKSRINKNDKEKNISNVENVNEMETIEGDQEQFNENIVNKMDKDNKLPSKIKEDQFKIRTENAETGVEEEKPVKTKSVKALTDQASKRKMSIPRKVLSESVQCPKFVYKYNCNFCCKKFLHSGGLIRHERDKHWDELKFECDVCNEKFTLSSNLDRHMMHTHKIGKKRIERKKSSSTLKEQKVGEKMCKSPDGTYTCEVCGKVLPKSRAEVHARLHTGERPFICHKCGKGLISDKKLKRHLLIHSEAKRHTCDVCGEGFAIKHKLRTHMFLHTGHKPYLCSVCGAEFNNSTSLQHHHRTVHLGDKSFECTICGGRYGKKSQLDEHMFSHSNERTQTCRFCGKTFKHAKSLRRHESTHVSDQKFSCDQCDSKFSRKDNLERHKMVHIQATLKCQFCKKKFTDRTLLGNHEQYHINLRKHQCQICKEKFQSETYFYNHMEKAHDMTREMVEMMNIKREQEKATQGDISGKDMLSHGIVMDTDEADIDQSQTITITQDTLNFSMNVAGILPASSEDMITCTTSASIPSATALETMQNQTFTPAHNIVITNGARTILNQPNNGNFTTNAQMIPGLNDAQRTYLTTSDSLIINEQQRIMQGALGSGINIQTPSFHMKNLF